MPYSFASKNIALLLKIFPLTRHLFLKSFWDNVQEYPSYYLVDSKTVNGL